MARKKRNRFYLIAIPLIAVLACFVVYDYGFQRLETEQNDLKETKRVKMRTLSKYISAISEKPQLEKRIAELKELKTTQNRKMIDGQTVSIAAANLQNTVRNMITSRGGNISSERVEKPEDLGKFKQVCISVDTIIPDSAALSGILYAMETQTPYLLVKELDSRIVNYNKPKELFVKFRVAALTSGR